MEQLLAGWAESSCNARLFGSWEQRGAEVGMTASASAALEGSEVLRPDCSVPAGPVTMLLSQLIQHCV